MKKNRDREESHHPTAHQPEGKYPPDNILVFLVLATLLLAVSIIPRIDLDFFQGKDNGTNERKINRYIWLTGSSVFNDGLYHLTPEMMGELFPDCLQVAEDQGIIDSGQTVYAIDCNGDLPQPVNLPPDVANIFFQPIPVNRAGQALLGTLPGIGPVLAARIVQQRNEKGPFRSLDDLQQVTGIGPKKLARLTEYIFIDN
jgi:competence ComEA-like helix-hairpin-helix protein